MPPRPIRCGVAAAKTQASPSLVGITPAWPAGLKIHSYPSVGRSAQ